MEDILSRARTREADLDRMKGNNEEGHKVSECPKVKAIQAKPLKSIKEENTEVPKAKARVYPMTVEEAKLIPDVITSIILINSLPARVLYDSGASVSFVSYGFSEKLSTPLNKLQKSLEVEIADSKVVAVTNVYRDVDIERWPSEPVPEPEPKNNPELNPVNTGSGKIRSRFQDYPAIPHRFHHPAARTGSEPDNYTPVRDPVLGNRFRTEEIRNI
ncbi:reverse transcriptase domain-containing protein [Artemisia annua]|uniref:Reverse transcriptase domain-containing protein n=1 Tax=Artemisia annua TaxID=35608 RepID=A0A2U1KQX5_ARTAN|nr:reverse transcriptase domain-containing protein [Artemisia annua]